MTDTPETDAAFNSDDFIGVIMEHAKLMERERNESARILCELKDSICARLAAGDEANPELRLRVRDAFDASEEFLYRMAARKEFSGGVKP